MRDPVQVVIGAGQVGTALAHVLGDVRLVDIDDPPEAPADVIHIAFPWSPSFITDVARYRRRYESWLVVVHSTVPVGTCDPHGWVHSPVRGRHPDLVDGIKTFTKHFGGAYADAAAALFADVSVDVATTAWAATTEAGKLWELVAFGLQVQLEKAIHDHCEQIGADYDVAYRQMAHSYNAGYRQLGAGHFTRPVLEHMPGPIGGHCVVPAAGLLDHPFARLVDGGA